MFTVIAQAINKSARIIIDAVIIAVNIIIILPLLLLSILSIIISSMSTPNCSQFKPGMVHTA